MNEMIPFKIKQALLKDADCFVTNEWVLTILEKYNSQDLLDEAIDFLNSEGFCVTLDEEYESAREERERKAKLEKEEALLHGLEKRRRENHGSLLSKDAQQVLANFIERHKSSHKFLPYEYVDTFKPLNLDKDQYREVWLKIKNAGIKQVLEDFKSKPFDPSRRIDYTMYAVGVSFDERQNIISKLTIDQPLKFVPEPNNIYDEHAVRIETTFGELIGYVSREYNSTIFKNLIERNAQYSPKVCGIVGGKDGKPLGVKIALMIIQLKNDVDISIEFKDKPHKKRSVHQQKQSLTFEDDYEELDFNEELENSKIDEGYLEDEEEDYDSSAFPDYNDF